MFTIGLVINYTRLQSAPSDPDHRRRYPGCWAFLKQCELCGWWHCLTSLSETRKRENTNPNQQGNTWLRTVQRQATRQEKPRNKAINQCSRHDPSNAWSLRDSRYGMHGPTAHGSCGYLDPARTPTAPDLRSNLVASLIHQLSTVLAYRSIITCRESGSERVQFIRWYSVYPWTCTRVHSGRMLGSSRAMGHGRSVQLGVGKNGSRPFAGWRAGDATSPPPAHSKRLQKYQPFIRGGGSWVKRLVR